MYSRTLNISLRENYSGWYFINTKVEVVRITSLRITRGPAPIDALDERSKSEPSGEYRDGKKGGKIFHRCHIVIILCTHTRAHNFFLAIVQLITKSFLFCTKFVFSEQQFPIEPLRNRGTGGFLTDTFIVSKTTFTKQSHAFCTHETSG